MNFEELLQLPEELESTPVLLTEFRHRVWTKMAQILAIPSECPLPPQADPHRNCVEYTRLMLWMVEQTLTGDEFEKEKLKSLLHLTMSMLGADLLAQHKTARENLENARAWDPITGLLGRVGFHDKLIHILEDARCHGHPVALLICDIRRLRVINDVWGYPVGDIVLQFLAKQLVEQCPDALGIGRLADSSLAIIIRRDLEHALQSALKLRTTLSQEVKLSVDDAVPIEVAIGVAACPDHASGANDLLAGAEAALSRAKRTLRWVGTLHERGRTLDGPVTHEQEVLLRQALLQYPERIVPFYQPVYDLSSGMLFGYEVLARIWDGKQYLPAGLFVETAEVTDLILAIDNIVLDKALAAKRKMNLDGQVFFFNVPVRALEDPARVSQIMSALQRHNVQVGEVILEITERQSVKDPADAVSFVGAAVSAGLRIALDDFGSGFSSFIYTRLFKPEFVKLEGNLVREISRDPFTAQIIESLAVLMGKLNVKLVAEFIESDAILQQVKRLNIPYGQGYHLGRPLPCPNAPPLPGHNRPARPNISPSSPGGQL